MEINELVKLIVDNGTTVLILAYFVYRDYKFMIQLQSTLQTLVDLTKCVHEVVRKDKTTENHNLLE